MLFFIDIDQGQYSSSSCSCSSMDRTLVSGTEDLGSTPSGSATLILVLLYFQI